jgi:DNA-binding CsgD family transcriptional regulator
MRQADEISDKFLAICKQLEIDLRVDQYKDQLIDWSAIDNKILFGNQFFYINDFTNGTNIYVHPNAESITGYSSDEFLNFGRIYELMHPDDCEFVFEFSKRSVLFTKNYKKELLEKPFDHLFSIDFRLKHKEGHYIRLNRQTTCLKTDKEGNMVFALVFFTDITHIRHGGSYNIHWQCEKQYVFYFEDLIRKFKKDYAITKREKEVLSKLADGASASEIARLLFVSESTVISHRKNMLHKTGTRNTAELVKLAIEKGLF